MITTCPLLPAFETAVILRQRLGPVRAWTDFLSDCIRGRTNLVGHTLMPYAVNKDVCGRPLYHPGQFGAFIDAALASDASLGKEAPRVLRVEVDTDPRIHWSRRVAKPATPSSRLPV